MLQLFSLASAVLVCFQVLGSTVCCVCFCSVNRTGFLFGGCVCVSCFCVGSPPTGALSCWSSSIVWCCVVVGAIGMLIFFLVVLWLVLLLLVRLLLLMLSFLLLPLVWLTGSC